MIYETCKEFDDIGGPAGVNVTLMLICRLCNKREKCHAEIKEAKLAKNRD